MCLSQVIAQNQGRAFIDCSGNDVDALRPFDFNDHHGFDIEQHGSISFKDVGIVRFSEPKVPTGKIESGSKEDTLTSYEVTRKSVWIDDPDYVAPDPEALLRESLIKIIKTEAYERIIQIIPEWKQRNLTAQAAQLAEKGRVNWTAEELAAWDAGVLIWDQVSVIRSKSDSLEQSVLEMTYDELKEFDPRLDEVWV